MFVFLSNLLKNNSFDWLRVVQQSETIVAVTSAMNVFNGVLPPYAAAVMVELIKVDSEYFVQLLYRNDSTRGPFVLTLPGECNLIASPWLLLIVLCAQINNR